MSFLQGDRNGVKYIEAIEAKLRSETLSNDDAATLYTNMGAALLDLGLFRKCIKACQDAIDRSPNHVRSHILKGKAFIALGKKNEAIEGWQGFLAGDTMLCDVLLLQELRDLLTEHSKGQDAANSSANVAAATVPSPPPPAPSAAPTPEKKVPISLANPTSTKKSESPAPPSPPPATSQSGTPTSKPVAAPNGAKKAASPKPAPAPTTATSPPSSADQQKDTLRKALGVFHSKNIGNASGSQIRPLFLKAMKGNLPHLCGEDLVDDLVGLGYINVNSGNHNLALTVFKLLLEYRTDLPSALIGLGSIHAMQRQLDLAITELTAAIEIDGSIADAWKRRGQTKAAKGLARSALKDLTKALSLLADPDIYYQRGLVYNQTKNYSRALVDFKAAHTKGMNTAALMNYMGMCEGQLGNAAASIECHKLAVAADPKLREAHLNMALMYKEVGQWREADKQFQAAINADTSRFFSQAHNYRSVMFYQIGRPTSALKITITLLTTLNRIISEAKETTSAAQTEELLQAYMRAAVFCQALGHYKKCIYFYDQALCLDAPNNCFFQREIALLIWHHLDVDLRTFSLDDRVDSRLKDGWCKHEPFKEYLNKAMAGQFQGQGTTHPYVRQMPPIRIPDVKIKLEDDCPGADNANNATLGSINYYPLKARLIELTRPYSAWIQLQTPGFLTNIRQHRMFGVSVVQMAAALRRHMTLIQLEGVGLEIPDAMSSKLSRQDDCGPSAAAAAAAPAPQAGASSSSSSASSSSSSAQPSSGKRGSGSLNHSLGWRDFFDIIVRWRQISEPNDPVWWIDRFPIKSFSDGFGLQTPIVNGQMKTVRYYPYFPRAFSILKEALQEGYYTAQDRYDRLDQSKRTAAAAAATLEEVYEVVGRDFYIIVPCPSLRAEGLILEGTRLTLVAREPEGFEFTIRTPGKPYRWGQYEAELDCSFHRLEEAFMAALRHTSGGVAASPEEAAAEDRSILRAALEVFYLWVTMAPLSRGTAACGYAALLATLLAHGKTFAAPLPAGKQLDWEAIFATNCAEFVDRAVEWLPLTDAGIGPLLEEAEPCFAAVTTFRDMLDLLALPYPACE